MYNYIYNIYICPTICDQNFNNIPDLKIDKNPIIIEAIIGLKLITVKVNWSQSWHFACSETIHHTSEYSYAYVQSMWDWSNNVYNYVEILY